MSENKKKIEVILSPGFVENFDGTQEELDEIIAHIKNMAETGELFENAVSVDEDIEDLIDETNPLEIEQIVNEMLTPRTVH